MISYCQQNNKLSIQTNLIFSQILEDLPKNVIKVFLQTVALFCFCWEGYAHTCKSSIRGQTTFRTSVYQCIVILILSIVSYLIKSAIKPQGALSICTRGGKFDIFGSKHCQKVTFSGPKKTETMFMILFLYQISFK